jgi:integrase/recombinase XerD
LSFSEIGDAYYDSRLLGHAKLENTALYTRVATKTIQQVVSPLEHIALKLKRAEPPT